MAKTLSVVIPAFNEAENLPPLMETIPLKELGQAGWRTEVLVVDNNSTDGTGELARQLGATVIFQKERGYGNAYRAGLTAASGDVIATGDADCTYPFDSLPEMLAAFEAHAVEFLTTNRLLRRNRKAMKRSHALANHVLSGISRSLFRNNVKDSQSGMWIFRRYVWEHLRVESGGMAFSQEIKNAATTAGFRFTEVPIVYRPRGGEVKLNALPDGVNNLLQLFEHRFRKAVPVPVQLPVASAEQPAHAAALGAI